VGSATVIDDAPSWSPSPPRLLAGISPFPRLFPENGSAAVPIMARIRQQLHYRTRSLELAVRALTALDMVLQRINSGCPAVVGFAQAERHVEPSTTVA
jgi:hypothetical protein